MNGFSKLDLEVGILKPYCFTRDVTTSKNQSGAYGEITICSINCSISIEIDTPIVKLSPFMGFEVQWYENVR